MRTRHTSLSAALGAALLAVTLTSCSGDPEPIIEPAPSTSPSSSTPASPSATPTPDEPESAKAFIRRWQAASFEMQNSGEPSEYLAMTESCASCDALAEGVLDIYADGGSVRKAGGTVSSIKRVGKADSVLIYEFELRTRQSAVLDRDGNVATQLTGGRARYQINLTERSRSWLVTSVSRLEP